MPFVCFTLRPPAQSIKYKNYPSTITTELNLLTPFVKTTVYEITSVHNVNTTVDTVAYAVFKFANALTLELDVVHKFATALTWNLNYYVITLQAVGFHCRYR